MRRHLHTFDKVVADSITALPKWLHIPMTVISFLGQPVVTIGLAMFIIGIGFKTGNTALMIGATIAIATIAVSSILKLVLRRNRPLTQYVEEMFFHTFSFPSGHAASVVPTFGLISYLLFNLGGSLSLTVAIIAALLPLLVGVSRVYLGAHYASDVVGGWLLGAAGLAIIIFIVQPTL